VYESIDQSIFCIKCCTSVNVLQPYKTTKVAFITYNYIINTIEVIIICFNSLQLLLCVVLVLMTFKDSFRVGCSTCQPFDQSHGAL